MKLVDISGHAIGLAMVAMTVLGPVAAHAQYDNGASQPAPAAQPTYHHHRHYHHTRRYAYDDSRARCEADRRASANRGTAIGAVGGGILGSALGGGRLGNTLLGAGAGALAGHEIGRSSSGC
jgi:uncharacterized protein YcfJ